MIEIEGSLDFFHSKTCDVEHTFFSGINKGSETEKGQEKKALGFLVFVLRGSVFFTQFHGFLCFFVIFFRSHNCSWLNLLKGCIFKNSFEYLILYFEYLINFFLVFKQFLMKLDTIKKS